MNKTYLVTYNTDINFNPSIFHNYIVGLFNRGYITDWWHYIDNTYLVATSLNINQLYNELIPGLGARYLFIIEVDPKNIQGWLPKDAWTWLYKYQGKG